MVLIVEFVSGQSPLYGSSIFVYLPRQIRMKRQQRSKRPKTCMCHLHLIFLERMIQIIAFRHATKQLAKPTMTASQQIVVITQ